MSLSASTMPDFELRQLVEQLTKERDEAETRGFERGVRKAAKAVEKTHGLYSTKTAEAALNFALLDILALLEPTLQEHSK
jgi:hypothetical protein